MKPGTGMWGTKKKLNIFADIINGRFPAGQNGRWVDGGGESAKEAGKIGLTSERGRRPPFMEEVARPAKAQFAPTEIN